MTIQMIENGPGTLRQFRQHDAWTRQQREAYQAEHSHRLRQHTAARSHFYQQVHQGRDNHPLKPQRIVPLAQDAAETRLRATGLPEPCEEHTFHACSAATCACAFGVG